MSRILVLLLCSLVEFQSATVFQNGPDVVVRPERQLGEADMQPDEADMQPDEADMQPDEADKQLVEADMHPDDPRAADVLASVRQYPAQLHKCTGTFIAADVLLTTAKCLYCEDCYLFVHALSSHLTDEGQRTKGQSYKISKTAIHPDYEVDPDNNDIGLIKLTKKVKKAVVFDLPKNLPDAPGQNVTSYTWQFTSNFQEYRLEKVTEKTISNEVCSFIYHRHIDQKHVCSNTNKPVTLGPFDEGAPLVEKAARNGMIIGFFQLEGRLRATKYKIYRSIYPYVKWIEKTIKCNFCSSSVDDIASSTTPSTTPSTTASQNSFSTSTSTFSPIIYRDY